MTPLRIVFEEPAWPHLSKDTPVDKITEATMLVGGMSGGASSVCLRIEDDEGNVRLAQTSLKLLETLVKACRGREAAVDRTLLKCLRCHRPIDPTHR